MERYIGPYTDHFYFLFRIFAGVLFACHGAMKLFGWFGAEAPMLSGLPLVAGIIELVGGLMIAAGLFTSIAAFLASGTMAFAYFLGHAGHGFWPIENKGELAVLYCFAFLYIAARGTGRFGLMPATARKG